jgi:hypothetical protein
MTNAQLIEHLKTHDPRLPAVVTWEGTVREIRPENVYPGRARLKPGDKIPLLFIDADDNDYKERFQSDEP